MSAAHSAAPAAERMLSVHPTTCAPERAGLCQSFNSMLTVLLMVLCVHTTVWCWVHDTLLPPSAQMVQVETSSIEYRPRIWELVLTCCPHYQHQPWHAQQPATMDLPTS